MRLRGELTDLCNALSRELSELNRLTEAEFLGVGEQLQQISRQARELASLSGNAAAVMGGQDFLVATDELRSILSGIERSGRASGESRSRLADMRGRIDQCRGLLAGFSKLVLILKVLALQIRIESARVHDAETDFSTVGDEVGRLAIEIEGNSERIVDGSLTLGQLVEKTLAQLGELGERQKAEISGLVRDTTAGLDSLSRNNTRSSEAAASIGTRYETVCRGISEVVRSLQFQDITRQQLEHVGEALAEVSERLNQDGEAPDTIALAVDAVSLQIAQLHNSCDTLVTAVQRIVNHLRSITVEADRISAAPAELARSAGSEGSSVLDLAREKLSAVAAGLGTYSGSSAEVRDAIRRVVPGIENMSGAASQIEGIGFRLGLTALNAQVKTAQIGVSGAALGVLAGKIQELTAEASACTRGVAEHLRSLAGDAQTLRQDVIGAGEEDESGAGIQWDSLTAEFSERISHISELNRGYTEQLMAIATAGCRLHEQLEATSGGITAESRAREVFGKVIRQLEALLARLEAQLPAGYQRRPAQELEIQKTRYTMDSEREVHERHAGRDAEPAMAAEAAPYPAAVSAGSSPEDDLGDNVELF